MCETIETQATLDAVAMLMALRRGDTAGFEILADSYDSPDHAAALIMSSFAIANAILMTIDRLSGQANAGNIVQFPGADAMLQAAAAGLTADR